MFPSIGCIFIYPADLKLCRLGKVTSFILVAVGHGFVVSSKSLLKPKVLFLQIKMLSSPTVRF